MRTIDAAKLGAVLQSIGDAYYRAAHELAGAGVMKAAGDDAGDVAAPRPAELVWGVCDRIDPVTGVRCLWNGPAELCPKCNKPATFVQRAIA